MDDAVTADPSAWQALLEEVTLGRCGQAVTIEVVGDELGDQVPVHGLPLDSLSHDARGDVLVVALGGASPADQVVLRHMVRRPRSLDLLEQPHGCLVLRVVDASHVRTLIALAPDHASSLHGNERRRPAR